MGHAEQGRERAHDEPGGAPVSGTRRGGQVVGYVLVSGVVYQLDGILRRHRVRNRWMRISVPPDAVPGCRSRWPAFYSASGLPGHEVIDAARALKIQHESLERLRTFDARTTAPTIRTVQPFERSHPCPGKDDHFEGRMGWRDAG
ncbi:hypothetical protein GCM10023322_06780 [Rugosimonospora acidiphila]|uniref:Uncharacterized protein n=1 Tax=Rugosimonospora acidiphila TaxID=556531 RepID=A0ABP9RK48_9ACTN